MGIIEKIKDNRVAHWINNHIIGWIKENKITTVFTLLLIGLVFFVDVFYVGNFFLGTPEFCALSICHEGRGTMAPYTETYWESPHGKQNFKFECMECHGPVNVVGINTPYLTKWWGHSKDGLLTWVKFFQGIDPTVELELGGSRPTNERCLYCHGENAVGEGDGKVYPLEEDAMSSPIDVTEKFEQAKNNPNGYECMFCHAYITHPYDGRKLKTPRGAKYNYTHPGFPKIDLGTWKQQHWHAIGEGKPIMVNGVERQVDAEMCKICHQGKLAPEKLAEENVFCYGCHTTEKWEDPFEVAERFIEMGQGGNESQSNKELLGPKHFIERGQGGRGGGGNE